MVVIKKLFSINILVISVLIGALYFFTSYIFLSQGTYTYKYIIKKETIGDEYTEGFKRRVVERLKANLSLQESVQPRRLHVMMQEGENVIYVNIKMIYSCKKIICEFDKYPASNLFLNDVEYSVLGKYLGLNGGFENHSLQYYFKDWVSFVKVLVISCLMSIMSYFVLFMIKLDSSE